MNKQILRLVLGDSSGKGHGITKVITVKVGHYDRPETWKMLQALKRGQEKSGVDFENLACADATISAEDVEKLKKAGMTIEEGDMRAADWELYNEAADLDPKIIKDEYVLNENWFVKILAFLVTLGSNHYIHVEPVEFETLDIGGYGLFEQLQPCCKL